MFIRLLLCSPLVSPIYNVSRAQLYPPLLLINFFTRRASFLSPPLEEDALHSRRICKRLPVPVNYSSFYSIRSYYGWRSRKYVTFPFFSSLRLFKVRGKAGAITGISIFSLGTNRSPDRTRNRSRIDFIRAGIIDAMEFMNKVFPLIIEVPLLLCFFFTPLFFFSFFFNEGEMKGERENKSGKRSFLQNVVELKAMGYHPFPSSLFCSTILHGGFDGFSLLLVFFRPFFLTSLLKFYISR